MGLDSYLYKTKKKADDKFRKWIEDVSESYDKIDGRINELKAKYHCPEDDFDENRLRSVLSKEESNGLDLLFKKQRILDGKNPDTPEDNVQLCNWRKAWGLHSYIVSNCGDPTDDNCSRIYLTKEFVEKLVKELERHSKMTNEEFSRSCDISNPFRKDYLWNMDDVMKTRDIFKDVLDNWDDEHVYYFFSWY